MTEQQDSLQPLPSEHWAEPQERFGADYPRGMTGYNALETQMRWKQDGVDFVFKVYCPYGDVKSGMVAVLCDTDAYFEILIECPCNDTSKLEDALRNTKVIDWRRYITVLFVSNHVIEGIRRIIDDLNVTIDCIHPLRLYILDKNNPLFEVSLPPDVTFKPLTLDQAELVNSEWPHRYPGSVNYFRLLIQAKTGFGLFKNDEIVAWGFVKETGALGNIFTLERFRRQGYGEVVTKLISNFLLKQKRYVNSYCLEGNVGSCKMHEKLGFERLTGVASCHLQWKS